MVDYFFHNLTYITWVLGHQTLQKTATNLVNNFRQMSLKLLSSDDKFYCHNARNSISSGAQFLACHWELATFPQVV